MKSLHLIIIEIILISLTISSASAQSVEPQVAVGKSQSVIINDKGKVYTFGSGSYGSLGQSSLSHNEIATALSHPNLNGYNIIDVAVSNDEFDTFVLLLADDGTVFSFGKNSYGQLGLGDQVERFEPTPITHDSLAGVKIIDIQAGRSNSILLSDSGDVYVMGNNNNGYLGIGTITPDMLLVPTKLTHSNLNGYTISKIAAGGTHAFLLASNDTLFAFGENINGQLGDGTTVSKTVPTIINSSQFGGKRITKMSITHYSSLFLMADSTVYSWGNHRGGLGQGTLSADITTPTQITHANISGKKIIDISISQHNGFLVDKEGVVYAFGVEEKALGLKANSDVMNPTAIPQSLFGGKKITSVSSGLYHTLFLASDGTLFSTGRGLDGELGSRYAETSLIPMYVDSINYKNDRIKGIQASYGSSFLISDSGKVYSFGGTYADSTISYLGRTAKRTIARPTLLSDSEINNKTFIKAVAAGERTFLLTDEGKVYAFGLGINGYLGTGDSLNIHTPTLIDHSNIGSKKIVKIATASNTSVSSDASSHTLLLAEDGTLFGFGDNSEGQLGLGDNEDRAIPTEISHANLSGKTISEIAVGAQNSMVITTDGTVFIWGNGGKGEMGYGNTNDVNVPTEATHLTALGKQFIAGDIGQIFTIGAHFILIASDSSVYGFGENSDGQLGLGNKTDNYIPTKITSSNISGKKPIAVSAGSRSSMLLMQDGSVFSFGNTYKVGIDGSTITDKTEPTLLDNSEILGKKAIAISSHNDHGLVIMDEGTILSFGSNELTTKRLGALGNGLPESGILTPQPIANFNWLTSPIPTTNLAMHLDASRGFTTSNDSISVWADLSGNSHHATQDNLSRRPVVQDSAFNQHAALRIRSGLNYIALPTSVDLGIQNNDYEMFIVAKTRTSNSNTAFLIAGGLEQFELHINGSAGARFIPNTSKYIDTGSISDFSDAEAHLFNIEATSTYGKVKVNRSLSTIDSSNAHGSYSGPLYLGIRNNNTLQFDGYISEVIIYNNVLSNSDRNKVESYLFKKYAIQNYKESTGQLTGTEGWRLLTSPVADSSFAPLLDNLWTQGFTGADYSGGASNVYRWPNTAISLSDTNWIAIDDISDSFNPGEGILMYVFSDDNGPGVEGNAGFPKTLSLEGREPIGTQSLTSLLNSNTNGWAMLGNPFRTDIDWDDFAKTGLSNSVYVYDHNSSGWKSWNGMIGSLTAGKIGAFNGFFVQTIDENPSLEIPESAKTDSTNFLGKQVVQVDPYYFSLEAKSDSGLANKAWFQFSDDGELGIDATDAFEFASLSASYVSLASILNDTTKLDINSLPFITESLEIPLELNTTEKGTHTLALKDVNFPEDWQIELIDNETNINSTLEEEYAFEMKSSKIKATQSQDALVPISISNIINESKTKDISPRFSIRITPSTAVGNEVVSNLPKTVELQQNYPNPFNPSTTITFGIPENGKVSLEVFDILGRKVATLINHETITAGRYTINFDARHLASGMYIYRLQAGNSIITKKLTLIK